MPMTLRAVLRLLIVAVCMISGYVQAQTYANTSATFNWVDTSGAPFVKVGFNTVPYRFNGGGGCGTNPPTLDDTISDLIPIGFNFTFGTTTYTQVRVMTNGRLQFNNTTCGAGTAGIGPPQTYPYLYPNGSMNNTMKVFGVDLDHTNLVDVPGYPPGAGITPCASIATCYISVGTTGTAPNRRFVVTWWHVPEWVNANNTSGSFDVQIILNEDGTFIYQYGNIVHGGTGQAQVGWQLTTTNFSVLTFGAASEPPPNTAILFYIPSPVLAWYQFEQGAWAPDMAGQVLDSAGSNYTGETRGKAQVTPIGRVCRGGDIPANTSAATVDAIRTGINISAFPALQGTGSVMFWFKANTAWNDGIARQLLDATTVANEWFYLTKTSTGALRFEIVDSTGVSRSVTTAAQAFGAGTWQHVTVSWNFNGLPAANSDNISIFINGGAPLTSSFTSNGQVRPSVGFVFLGDNPIGVAATNGTVNSANGTFDEAQFFNYAVTQGQVLARMAAGHPCDTFNIDHLELRHTSWSGVSCMPGTMTVVACENASFPCTAPYTKGLIATLTASGGQATWVPPGDATMVIPYGTSSATKNFYVGAGSATLDASSSPVNSNPTRCNGVGNSCLWTSTNAGLLIKPAVVDGGGAGIITGGQPTGIGVQAVKSVAAVPVDACEAVKGLSGAGLKVWATPTIPASFPATSTSNGATVGGAPQISSTSGGTYSYAPSTQPGADNLTGLAFDANATTTVWVKHMDTGQWTLSARLDTSASSSFPALSLNGSGVIKTVPVGYGVTVLPAWLASGATQAACSSGSGGACDAAAGVDPKVAAAGDTFSSRVAAALWTAAGDADFSDNPVAPSYSGNVTLSAVLQAPQAGATGSLTTNAATLSNGTSPSFTQAWSQSGALRIQAAGTYLGQSVSSQTPVIGRIVPRFFRTRLTTAACGAGAGAFTYSRQPITAVTVEAMDGSATPAITPNYTGAFARPVTLTNGNAPDVGVFSANTILPATFAAGAAVASPVYTFTVAETPPKTLALRAADCATVGAAPTVCSAPTTIEVTSAATAGAEAEAILYSGRLGLKNAFGSELLPLKVTAQTEYFISGGWTRNLNDNCTPLVVPTSANSGLLFFAQTGSNQLAAGETTARMRGGVASPATVLAGDSQLELTAPGGGNYGFVDVDGALLLSHGATPPSGWLSSVPAKARACFGICGARTPVIYSRERY